MLDANVYMNLGNGIKTVRIIKLGDNLLILSTKKENEQLCSNKQQKKEQLWIKALFCKVLKSAQR